MKLLNRFAIILVTTIVQLSFADDNAAKFRDFENWLGPLAPTAGFQVSSDFFDFKNLSPLALRLYLGDPKLGWQIKYYKNYNWGGESVSPIFDYAPSKQGGEEVRILQEGFVFASRFFENEEKHFIFQISGPSFCRKTAKVYSANSSGVFADQVRAELESYVKQNNPYKNSVLHSVQDEWGIRCFTYLENVNDYNYNWEDFIAESTVKDDIYKNTIQFVQNFPIYEQMNKKVKRGALLYGPPGTGKSFIGQVLISQILHGDLQGKSSMFVVTARHLASPSLVTQLFRAAALVGPSTIFMEDIDLLGIKSRNDSSRSGDALDKQILNEFLNQLDGLVDAPASLFIGTTNQVDNIDAALSRSGRLGLHYLLDYPTYFVRKEFFVNFLGKKNVILGEDVNLEWLTGETEGFTGADIIEAIEIARQNAYLSGSKNEDNNLILLRVHLEEAIDRVKNNNVRRHDSLLGIGNLIY